jgi:formate dehydrogenase maturation protein FdhE
MAKKTVSMASASRPVLPEAYSFSQCEVCKTTQWTIFYGKCINCWRDVENQLKELKESINGRGKKIGIRAPRGVDTPAPKARRKA